MWNTLVWRSLGSPDTADEIDDLRDQTLRLFMWLVGVGYVAWQAIVWIPNPPIGVPRYWNWPLFPVVLGGLAVTLLLRRRGARAAVAVFLASSAIDIAVAAWVWQSTLPPLFLPLVPLAAVALFHPLAGLLAWAGSMALLMAMRELGPLAFLAGDQMVHVGLAALAAVCAGWALGRNMVTAVEWSLSSYEQASRNATAARSHRAELVRALRQLDNVNYRLERANAALEAAWKAADAAERSKTEFVTNISHELRTPLNLIVGFADMIVTTPESYGATLPPAFRGDLNAIYRSAQHLLTLTDDVLDLARVGMGRLALARDPVDLGQVIHDAADIVREYVEAKGLWLQIDVPAGLPILSLDRLRIRQVLLNLLTNAARFTERGGITVSADLTDSAVVVRVADTGRGIAPDGLTKVFEHFYHGGSTDARPEGLGGVGLGLPLSRRFVELHGGQVGVESTPDVGTTFWFTLPLHAVEGHAAEAWRATALVGHAAERVLVLAGGDGRLARFLERHLRACRVVAAPNMARAVEVAVEVRAAAILADAAQPRAAAVGAPALEARAGARGDADLVVEAPVPVFRLPLPHTERLAEALGASDYLVKPITRHELAAALARLGCRTDTVLIVDDDPHFVRLVSRFLRGIAGADGRQVLTAHSGHEALAILETRRPDVVLLDVVMPELGGAETLAEIRRRPEMAGIPVIVLSGQEGGEGPLRLDGALTVVKPDGFKLEELLAAIEGLVDVLEPPRRYLSVSATAQAPRVTARG
ncbi:MAG: hybrid sensor histidine kinase/response regulator [Chloroflexota bacterium]|nr:MAG: hybrid sensor histidine kinase/response regulator [Chloroflexota bacterium]